MLTHLRRESQRAWLGELGRVLRKGGFALVTFHDEDHPSVAKVGLTPEDILARGFIVHHDSVEGSNYMASFQSRESLREEASAAYDVVEIVPSAQSGFGQALAVLQKI